MSWVFLSHSSRDKHFAWRLAEALTSYDVQVWIDDAELDIGDSLVGKISSAIDKADFVVAVLSQNSVRSNWVQKELQIAMTKEIEGRRVKVLPVLIERCDIPEFLIDKVYADFTDPSEFDGPLFKLLRAVGVSPTGGLRTQIRIKRCIADLTSTDVEDRMHGADMVREMGGDAAKAIPYLIHALGDDDAHLRGSAMKALGAIGPAAKVALPEILDTLLRTSTKEALLIVDVTLEGIEAGRLEVVQHLTQALGDEDSKIRRRAIELLGKMGSDAPEPTPALCEILLSSCEAIEVRMAAAEAVGSMVFDSPHARGAILQLFQILLDGEQPAQLRHQICEIFTYDLGDIDKRLLSSLIRTVEDADQPLIVRQGISGLLLHVVPSADNASVVLPFLGTSIADELEDTEVRINAARALSQFRSRARSAVPSLLRDLRARSVPVELRKAVASTLGQVGGSRQIVADNLVELVLDSEEPTPLRETALSALSDMVPGRLDATSLIVEILGKRDELRELLKETINATRHLVSRLKAAHLPKEQQAFHDLILPPLVEVLSDESVDEFLRSNVADILGDVGRGSHVLVPPLAHACTNDSSLSWSAMRALATLDGGTETLSRIVLDKIERKEDLSTCLGLLNGAGVPEGTAVPLLIEALSDENDHIRETAVEALGEYGTRAAEAVPSLLKLIISERERNPTSEPFAYSTGLLSLARSDVYSVRCSIVETLGKIQKGGDSVIHRIIEEMGAGDERLQRKAVSALGMFAPFEHMAIVPLMDTLESDNRELRGEAVVALGQYGDAAREALQRIEELMQGADVDFCIKASAALKSIDSSRPVPEPQLAAFLNGSDIKARWMTADALIDVRPIPEGVIETLIEVVGSDGSHVANAMRSLARLGPLAIEALSALVQTFDRMPHLIVLAIETLKAIGPRAQAAVPRLNDLLSDDDASVRAAAEEALAVIAPR